MNPQITINHISFRATSSLNISSDICAICRDHIYEKCSKCSNKNNEDNKENKDNKCYKCSNKNNKNNNYYGVIGECGHAYHYCCILSWNGDLSTIRQKCPMCNQNWTMRQR